MAKDNKKQNEEVIEELNEVVEEKKEIIFESS